MSGQRISRQGQERKPDSADVNASSRHTADMRFTVPSWLGGMYFDLRVGRDARKEKRPHIIPKRVRRSNRVLITVGVQMIAAWLFVLGLGFYWVTQTACGGGVMGTPTASTDPGGSPSGTTVREDPGGDPMATRPRVDLMASELEAFRNITQDVPSTSSLVDTMISKTDSFVAQDVSALTDRFDRHFTISAYLRYAYLYTQDTQYADKAIEIAKVAATIWTPDTVNTDKRRAICEALSRTYDTCYDVLTAEERLDFEGWIRGLGATLYSGQYGILSNREVDMNTHIDTSVSFLMKSALAMKGAIVPEADDWLNACIDHYTGTIDGYPYPYHRGGSDGAYNDGLYYWGYGWTLRTEGFEIASLLEVADLYSVPSIRNAGYFPLYMAPPQMNYLGTFGDGGTRVGTAVGGHIRQAMFRLATGAQDPHFRWYAENRRVGSTAANPDPTKILLDGNPIPSLVIALRDSQRSVAAEAPDALPQSRYFDQTGYVSMHTDLGDPENDMVLNFTSRQYPHGAYAHAHADQNSFVLYYRGEPLAINAGNYYDYGSDYFWNWGQNTKSKNGVLINGNSLSNGMDGVGQIVAFAENAGFDYTAGEASQAYNARIPGLTNRVRRHIAFVRNGQPGPYVVIVDDIRLPAAGHIDWLLHSGAQPSVDEPSQQILLNVGNARALVQLVSEVPLSLSTPTEESDPPNNFDRTKFGEQWNITAGTTSDVADLRIASVFFPYGAGESLAIPTISASQAGSDYTVRVGGQEFVFDLEGNAVQASL